MNLFDTLADPVRRRLIETLADGEQAAGTLAAVVGDEFGISQPAASNQLRRLRDADLVSVRVQGSQRIYRLRAGALDDVAEWVDRYARLWPQRLDALDTELARGRAGAPPKASGTRRGDTGTTRGAKDVG